MERSGTADLEVSLPVYCKDRHKKYDRTIELESFEWEATYDEGEDPYYEVRPAEGGHDLFSLLQSTCSDQGLVLDCSKKEALASVQDVLEDWISPQADALFRTPFLRKD